MACRLADNQYNAASQQEKETGVLPTVSSHLSVQDGTMHSCNVSPTPARPNRMYTVIILIYVFHSECDGTSIQWGVRLSKLFVNNLGLKMVILQVWLTEQPWRDSSSRFDVQGEGERLGLTHVPQ